MQNVDLDKLIDALALARQAFAAPDEVQSRPYNQLYRRVINLELAALSLRQKAQSATKP